MASVKGTNTQNKNSYGIGMCNPVIGRMKKENQTGSVGGKLSSYGGVIGKTIYLILFCVAGIVGFYLAHNLIIENASADRLLYVTDFGKLTDILILETTPVEITVAVIAGLVTLIFPFAAIFIKSSIPVTGALYAMCEGYFIGMISSMLTDDYKWISIVAFVITVAIVVTMLFLYAKGIVRVGKKFRTFIFAFFIGSIVSGIALFALSFVPVLRPMMTAISTVMNNPIVSIGFSLLYLVIAVLFLISDFDAIKECVENNMPKKYEWLAAFGLVYSIIYIYFKILNIILKIVANSKE